MAAKSQNLMVQNGASFIPVGKPTIVLNNTGLDLGATENDWQNANLILTGGTNATIKSGNGLFNLNKLVVNKPNATVGITNAVQVFNEVQMVAGLLDLSGHDLLLLTAAKITGETETARITGPLGGVIRTTINMGTLNNTNVGGMGVFITTSVNNPTIDVMRGHKTPSGSGLAGAINRYYELTSNTPNLNATLKFTYFDAELNGQTESLLQPMESTNNGGSWSPKTIVTKDAAANYVMINGLNSLYRYTLGTPGNALPVMGLEFFAKRVNASNVQLAWKTMQEITNAGFAIERRQENEAAFVQKGSVPTKAAGGNSSTPLSYESTDVNTFGGKTYYRIKQTDMNGSVFYSPVRAVDGSNKTATLSVWPVPATGPLNLRLQGLEKGEAQVWGSNGQLVKQLTVNGGQIYTLQLAAGTYFVGLKGNPDLQQKVLVQ